MEKLPEIDKIINEMIKYGGKPLPKKITEICSKQKIENYRPFNLN